MKKYTIEISDEFEQFIKEYYFDDENLNIEKAIVRLLELLREKIDKENNAV